MDVRTLSRQRLGVFALGAALLILPTAAFGWAGNTHSRLAQRLLDDPNISPFISEFGIDRNAVIDWTSEPPDEWHHPGWEMVRDRGYLGTHNGKDWTSLSETTRLRYLIHIATDCGVPLGHSPANGIYKDTINEALLEAQVGTWDSWPSIVGTSYHQHSANGYAASLTGTYSEVTTTFYHACRNNASWFKSTRNWAGTHSTDENKKAGWNGTALGQMLGRAMLADYFLAKRTPTANAGGAYAVNPGGSVTLNGSGEDPDSVSWASNGTYSNNGGGLVDFGWDLTSNGAWNSANATGRTPTLSHSQLVGMLGYTEGKTIAFRVQDDEGKYGYAQTTLAVYSNPVAKGIASFGWMGKTGDVPSQWDWNELVDNGSFDEDGGSIQSWSWDLNNDGTFDKTATGAGGFRVYYSDFTSVGITANENHTVTLCVTDNEGAVSTQSGIAMPILVNPTADINGTHFQIAPGQTLNLSASGNDPDGGIITSWNWDLNGNGVFDDWSGKSISVTYLDLVTLGLMPGSHTIGLQATDDDAKITGWWAGKGFDTAQLTLTELVAGDADCDGVIGFSDLTVLAANYGLSNRTWRQGDFNNDGVVDFQDLTKLAARYSQSYGSMSLQQALQVFNLPESVPEPSAFIMLLGAGLIGYAFKRRRG